MIGNMLGFWLTVVSFALGALVQMLRIFAAEKMSLRIASFVGLWISVYILYWFTTTVYPLLATVH